MPTLLETDRIPFVLLELETSLLEDTADHQIALLNMESFDVNYCLRANTVAYHEQYDPAFEAAFNQGPETLDLNDDTSVDDEGNVTTGDPTNPVERRFGANDGVRYGRGLNAPGFFAPPSDPMRASMEKQQQLKDDIDRLLDLATVSSRSRYASAESKGFDERGLDSGLAAIGLVLENAERQAGIIWNIYDKGPAITVKYPERYSLRSDDDRRKDAKALSELIPTVPSDTFRKVGHREMAEIMHGGKISDEELESIFAEINASEFPTSDIEQIRADVEVGLVSRESGSIARGYPKDEAKKAEEEREKRDAAKAESQGVNLAARGLGGDPADAKKEKDDSQNPDNNPDGKKLVRGEGK